MRPHCFEKFIKEKLCSNRNLLFYMLNDALRVAVIIGILPNPTVIIIFTAEKSSKNMCKRPQRGGSEPLQCKIVTFTLKGSHFFARFN